MRKFITKSFYNVHAFGWIKTGVQGSKRYRNSNQHGIAYYYSNIEYVTYSFDSSFASLNPMSLSLTTFELHSTK